MFKIFIKNMLYAFLLSVLIASIVSLLTVAWVNNYTSGYSINGDKLLISNLETRVYDKYGNKLAEFQRENKKSTEYEDIPIEIVEALISTEDREFFDHPGVNIKAITRALVAISRSGDLVQGGSTITQQLIKTIYLDPGKRLQRKIDEAIYSFQLEEQYSKREILSYYLNHIFYGNRAYGIENAIRVYFGQTIDEFNKEEDYVKVAKSALLIGMPNAPSAYNPYIYPEKTMERRNRVITNMYVEGYISKEVYEKARKSNFLILDEPQVVSEDETIYYPEYVTYILNEAKDVMGYDTIEEVMYSGMQIHTSFDPEVYKIIRKHMEKSEMYPSNAYDGKKVEGSVVLIDPQTGEILAMSGSREEEKDFLVFNRAFQAKRQPGSTFKPIISYGPALESGKFTPYSTLPCNATFGDYKPSDHSCWGSMTMTEALRVSNNVPPIWTLQQVGIDYARNFAQKIGIKLHKDDIYLPIALGGITEGVTPLELADGYQSFANKGVKADAHTIRRISNSMNEIIYKASKPKQVIKEETATNMTTMLRNAVSNGTGRSAAIYGQNIAGKTGTNQMPGSNGNKDVWFVGYNERIVGSVWMGFDLTNKNHFIRAGESSSIPARMFREIVSEVLNYLPKSDAKEKQEYKKINFQIKEHLSGDKITLEWAPVNNIKYEIYRNNRVIGQTTEGEFTELLTTEGEHSYKIIGYDMYSGIKLYESDTKIYKVVHIQKIKPEDPITPEVEKTDSVKKEVTDQEKTETNKNEGDEEVDITVGNSEEKGTGENDSQEKPIEDKDDSEGEKEGGSGKTNPADQNEDGDEDLAKTDKNLIE